MSTMNTTAPGSMANTAVPGSPYRVPPEPNRTPSIILAVLMHAGLLFFLWAGIHWQNEKPVAIEAEVWDMKTQQAAPPPEPQAERLPPKPQPEPVEPVRPPPPPPPKVVEQPVAPKPPDIALEREKKRKELKLQREEEEELQQKKLAIEKRQLDKARKALAEQKQREQEEAEDKKAEQLAKDKADKLAKEKAEKADKLAKTKAAAAEQAKLDKLRDLEMRKIMGAAGTSGDAPKSSSPQNNGGYTASISSKIRPLIRFPQSEDVAGNPNAVFRIEQLPTGEVISTKMVKSSGLPAYDNAVEKAILAASPLPKRKDGTVERSLEIVFKVKDLN